MVWHNAILIEGTAGQPGAVYKFPSVTTGVYAEVELLNLVGGATLTSIDDNTFGYSAAWQPVVKTHTAQVAASSYASFRIEFKNESDGSHHVYTCFQLSFIDVDGDGQHVREFVAAKIPDSYTVSNATVLNIQNVPGSLVQATGPVANYTNIDTSSWNTNINFRYSSTDKVTEVRIGSTTDNVFTVQDRYSCGFFQQISMPVVGVMPVKYFAFNAVAVNKSVVLNWITEQEINNNYFEVERSFDGNNFTGAGIVVDGFESGDKKNYQFKDNAAELETKSLVYYRLKQVDNNGRFSYTNILVVRFQAKNNVVMQTNPNPFVENVSVGFVSTTTGNAEINIINVSGQKMFTKQSAVSKGYNTLQINGLGKLAPGMYIAQLTMNGVITDTQKIIKN